MKKGKKSKKRRLNGWLGFAVRWYIMAAIFNNFLLPGIDYNPSRFTIKKQEKEISEQYKPKKTYALFINGFPGINPVMWIGERKIRKTVEELNNRTNMEATFISYKDCESGWEIKSKLAEKIRELSKKVTEEDLFILAYSGHGGKGDGTGNLYLGKGPSISEFRLEYYLNKINSKHQIFISGSCYSGNLAEALKGTNRTTISLGSKNHATYTILGEFIPDIFTDDKKADIDKNGKVSLEESFIYASKNQWFTNYTNVFLQLPRQRPHLFSEGIDPNTIYLLDGGKE